MIPEKYKWLESEPGPKMLLEGLKIYGTAELVGPKHNPIILGWADEIGVGNIVNDDEQAWCGLAHAYVAFKAGKSLLPLKGWHLLRALDWLVWGIGVEEPELGDTLVFKRPGGGHVGIYIFETLKTYGCMGGNSSNTYKIVEIDKLRLVGSRRPVYTEKPPNVRKIFMSPSGEISVNEG
jgi:uncharacterized protein (TIGR02594 family)